MYIIFFEHKQKKNKTKKTNVLPSPALQNGLPNALPKHFFCLSQAEETMSLPEENKVVV